MGGTAYMHTMLTGLPYDPIFIVLIMMGILIVMGIFMDWIGICLLTMPNHLGWLARPWWRVINFF